MFANKFHIIIILMICICSAMQAQRSGIVDDDNTAQLRSLATSKSVDTNQLLSILDSIATSSENIDTVIKYSTLEIALAEKLNRHEERGKAQRNLALAYYYKNKIAESCKLLYNSVVLFDSLHDDTQTGLSYSLLGDILSQIGNNDNANDCYLEALKLFSNQSDSLLMSTIYRNMSNASMRYQAYSISKEYVDKAFEIDKKYNHTESLGEDYYIMGRIALREYGLSESEEEIYLSKEYLRKSFEYLEKTKCDRKLYRTCNTLIDTYLELVKLLPSNSSLDSTLYFINYGNEIVNRLGYNNKVFGFDIQLAKYYLQKGDLDYAKKQLDKIENTLKNDQKQAPYFAIKLCDCFVLYYTKQHNYEKALHYQLEKEKFDKTYRSDNFKAIYTQSEAKTEFDKIMQRREKEHKDEMALYKEKIQTQQFVSTLIIVITIMLLILFVILIYNSKRRHKLYETIEYKNKELEQQKEEMMIQNENLYEQKTLLQKANSQIKSSLEYAQRIQNAAMPSHEMMKSMFGDYLIFFRPLDIVSGDFYWAANVGRYKALAVADCTGHGVPGAFMSMLGLSALNDIVAMINYTDQDLEAADILNFMRDNLKRALRQNGAETDNHDGMDISLCLIDMQNKTLQYAGAFRPLIIVRRNEVIQYNADRMPIGVYFNESESFTNHIINIEAEDTIYLFTDGIVDQFGYSDKHCKYTLKRLRYLLQSIGDKPFFEQHAALDHEIYTWRQPPLNSGEQICEQTDDMLLVGIRL